MPGLLRINLPVAVTLKRLAIDFLVFCIVRELKDKERIIFAAFVKLFCKLIPNFFAGRLFQDKYRKA